MEEEADARANMVGLNGYEGRELEVHEKGVVRVIDDGMGGLGGSLHGGKAGTMRESGG